MKSMETIKKIVLLDKYLDVLHTYNEINNYAYNHLIDEVKDELYKLLDGDE